MAGTQYFIPIKEINNDLVFLQDGSVTMVLTTSAVNFGLLFETEQMSIISSFAGLLNSLSFPIQIVIQSKRLDVSSYLNVVDKAISHQINPKLRELTMHYRKFVQSSIKENNVLDKQFYVCLNVSAIELSSITGSQNDKIKKALTILIPRRDHLLRQLGRIGLKARQLSSQELVKVYYDYYNPVDYDTSDQIVSKAVKDQPTQIPPAPQPTQPTIEFNKPAPLSAPPVQAVKPQIAPQPVAVQIPKAPQPVAPLRNPQQTYPNILPPQHNPLPINPQPVRQTITVSTPPAPAYPQQINQSRPRTNPFVVEELN